LVLIQCWGTALTKVLWFHKYTDISDRLYSFPTNSHKITAILFAWSYVIFITETPFRCPWIFLWDALCFLVVIPVYLKFLLPFHYQLTQISEKLAHIHIFERKLSKTCTTFFLQISLTTNQFKPKNLPSSLTYGSSRYFC